MLEGLEISEVYSSTILLEDDKRIDPDFYSKSYLNLIQKISNGIELGKMSETYELHSNGAFKDVFNYLHNFDSKDIPYIRSENVGKFFIDGDLDYISNYAHSNLQKTKTQIGDIITARTGKVGGASIITKEWVNCNSNQNVVNIRLNNNYSISPFFLTTFLNTKYGIQQFQKSSTGNVQPWLNLTLLRKVKVPLISDIFQNKIENVVVEANDLRNEYKNQYSQAEAILLKEIGLFNFQPSKEPINIKSFKSSFGVTKRLDAEYYQKKYEQIIEKIVTQKHEYLINIVEISKSIEPGSNHYTEDKGLPFYRVADYNKFGLSKPDKELTASFVADNKDLIEKLKPKKGTILFSKDGSVGTAYLLRNDLDGITSGAILHLQVKNKKEILPEYLTLALNSKLVQMQAERDAGGSIILHWRKEEIEQVVVPIIDFKKQEQIAVLVEESFKLKFESERLLEVAKKAVEIAIEESEDVALKYLSNQL